MVAAPGRSVQIWSHRGRLDPGRFEADNTVAGIGAAVAAGVDGVEFDTWLTADGEFVCTHDRDTPAGPVDRCASSAVGHLDRLEPVLAAGAPVTMNVELKVPPDASPAEQAGLGEALRDRLSRVLGSGPAQEVVVSSFSAAATRPFLGAGLPLRVGHLCVDIPDDAGLGRLADEGYWGLHFLASVAADGGVGRIRAAGLVAVAWTVNEREQAEWLADQGVQVIISDVPGQMATVSGR